MKTKTLVYRNEDWALKLFRPLLRQLKLQQTGIEPTIIETSPIREFIISGMDNCVVVVLRFNFPKPEYQGVFVWDYNKRHDIYTLSIIINDNLFDNEDLNTRIRRKMSIVHEFTHCVASMLSLSRLKTEALIARFKEVMKEKIHAVVTSDIDHMLMELTMSYDDYKIISNLTFPDKHFRCEFEDFEGDYFNLYRQLLLSRVLFEEYFNESLQKAFISQIKNNCITEALNILVNIVPRLAEEKALDCSFIVQRIREEFLRHYC